MGDRLVELLKHFHLRARVFQSGPLCNTSTYDAGEGLGYIHTLHSGRLRVESPKHAPLVIEEPGLFFYMNPTSHKLTPLDGEADMVCASFEFGAGLLNPLGRALPDVVLIPLTDMPDLEITLELLFREAAEEHCGRQAVLDRLMEVVLVQVLRDLMEHERMQYGLLAALADARLSKALNALHADPARNWSLEDLAAVAGMSRARFAAGFRDIVGMTPGAYLAEWRLGIAQSLLEKGKSVQFIADKVGYGSASALSRAFRARTGQSPREWLQQHEAGT